MDKSIGDEDTIGPVGKSGGHAYALQSGDILGQYKIIKALGAGGMGEVYLVENIQMHKRYALKVLPQALSRDPQFIGRFKVEARVMADLSHPNIVGVHTMGEERGLYYLVMDYVEGPDGEPKTLEDVLRDEGRGSGGERGKKRDEGRGSGGGLPEAQVKDVALQICDALEYAHGFRDGVIHRDLKPSNILLSSEGRGTRVEASPRPSTPAPPSSSYSPDPRPSHLSIRVADFGLAKVVGESYLKSVIERSISLSIGGQVSVGEEKTERPQYQKTSTRSILGTYDYMSPEQKDGHELLNTDFEMRAEASTRRFELTPLRGGVTVTTVSGAEIVARREGTDVDIPLGQADGDGRLQNDRLTEGRYRLTIRHPDYEPKTERIEVRRDRPVAVDGRLRGLPGSIFVVASPLAEVWVDGERKGRTGEEISGLPPGERSFEVRCAGYRTERFTAVIPPNKAAPRRNLGNLSRESGAIRVVADVPESAREFFQRSEKRVRIGSKDWKPVQTLPWTADGLAVEEHEVRLEVTEFRMDEESRRVRVEDGKTATVRFTLIPEPARLTITANAAGAEVFDSDGKQLGVAGTAFEVASLVPISLLVRASGHAERALRLQAMNPGQTGRYQVTLERQRFPDLKSPWENSLGMKFNPVPGTDVLFGVWETRVQDYQRFVDATRRSWTRPSFEQGPTHPAVNVSWDDAVAFCEWLTKVERDAGVIGPNQAYRLPRDWEWSVAVGLNEPRTGTPQSKSMKDDKSYPWNGGRGTWPPPSGAGNYSQSLNVDRFPNTSPVGSFDANAHGLYDLGGNVWEWCEDFFAGSSGNRVLRGGSWLSGGSRPLLSSFRRDSHPGYRLVNYGFRVVLSGSAP